MSVTNSFDDDATLGDGAREERDCGAVGDTSGASISPRDRLPLRRTGANRIRDARVRMYEREPHTESRADERCVPAGFGERVERLLRQAEQEAAEGRDEASAQAQWLVDRAQSHVKEMHRQLDDSLGQRAAEYHHWESGRHAALVAREQQIGDQLAAAHRDAADIRAGAQRDAQRMWSEAEKQMRALRADAEHYAAEQRSDASGRLNRLMTLQVAAYERLSALSESLADALASSVVPEQRDRPFASSHPHEGPGNAEAPAPRDQSDDLRNERASAPPVGTATDR